MLAPEVDYTIKPILHGTYTQVLIPVESTNGGSSPTLGGGGQITSTFKIGDIVFNFSKSYFQFDITPAAGAHYNWVHLNGVSPIFGIKVLTTRGTYLINCDQISKYLNLILRRKTELQKLLSVPKYGETMFHGLNSSNIVVAANPTAATQRPTAQADQAFTSFTEASYVSIGADTTASPVISYRIPLSIFEYTVFTEKQDLYFDGDIVQIQVTWNNSNQIAWNANFTNIIPEIEKVTNLDENQVVDGVDLSKDYIYSVGATVNAGVPNTRALDWYFYAVTQRELHILPSAPPYFQ